MAMGYAGNVPFSPHISVPAPDIANAGNNARLLYEMGRNLGTDYRAGQDFQYQQRMRNLFQDGIPTGPDGQPDWNAALQQTLRAGGAPELNNVLPVIQGMQANRDFQQNVSGIMGPNPPGPATPQAGNPEQISFPQQRRRNPQPQSDAGAPVPDAGAAETVDTLITRLVGGRQVDPAAVDTAREQVTRQLGVTAGQALTTAQAGRALRSITPVIGAGIVQEQGGGDNTAENGAPAQPAPAMQPHTLRQLAAASPDAPGFVLGNAAGALGVSPDQVLNPDQMARAQRMFDPNAPIQPRPVPTQPVRMTQAPPQPQFGQPSPQMRPAPAIAAGPQNVDPQVARQPLRVDVQKPAFEVSSPLGTLQDAQTLETKAALLNRAAMQPFLQPQQAARAGAAATAMREQAKQIREDIAKRAGEENPELQSQLATSREAGKGVGESISEAVKAVQPARDMIANLDIIGNALQRSGGNLSTGPGAEYILEGKRFLANVGALSQREAQGLTDAETIQKLNAALASEAARQMSGRPTQREFQIWQANSPGLMTSQAGTMQLISILRQSAQRRVALGEAGMDPAGQRNWAATQANINARFPVVIPRLPSQQRSELPSGVRSIRVVPPGPQTNSSLGNLGQ